MFSRVDFGVVEFSSKLHDSSTTEEKKKAIIDASSQTEIAVAEEGNQAPERVDFGAQSEGVVREFNSDYDVDKLAAFLNRVGPSILETLDNIVETDVYLPTRSAEGDYENTVKISITIQSNAIPEIPNVEVSCLAWSFSGNMLILGYGRLSHEDWCTHSSCVQFFNINTSDFDGHTPTYSIPTSSCVTALATHPYEPAVVAVGTAGGEVHVFDLQKGLFEADIGNSVFHKDRVTKVSWVHINNQLFLVTCSLDSYIFLYKFTRSLSSLILSDRYIMTNDIKHISAGITTFAFYHQPSIVFIVALESGELIHCSTSGAPIIASSSAKNPVLRTIARREALVLALEFCPKMEDIFVAAFTDDKIVTYSLKEASSLQEIFVHFNVRGMQCSATQRGFIYLWGNSTKLYIYEYNDKKKNLKLNYELLPESNTMKCLKLVTFNDSGSKIAVSEDKKVMILDISHSKL